VQDDQEMIDEATGVVKDQKNQEDIKHEVEDERIRKHTTEKEKNFHKLTGNFSYMRHYLNCGLNLLIYGVGSKRSFLNHFT